MEIYKMRIGTSKIRHYIVVVVFAVFLNSCMERGISSEEELLEQKIKVMYKHDFDSYMELENYYFRHKDRDFELLPYTLKVMKEDSLGYKEFFYIYMKISFNNKYDLKNITKLSTKEREFLMEILTKGAKRGDFTCDSILSVLPK